jgi:DNA processing protein
MKKEILLAHFPKINNKRYQQLLEAFSNIEDAWNAKEKQLLSIGWKKDLIDGFLLWKKNLDIEKIQKILDHENIKCIIQDDEDYPPLLKEIYDPPFCLFVRGDIKDIKNPVAVVGPRKFSTYGKQVAEEIVSKLSKNNIEIISGLALGIDGIAHTSCIQSGGRTIAVLGSGINKRHVFPSKHRHLSEKIIECGGAVISEYPPGALPNTYTFPRRNRIVAGMSIATLVVEATEKSGALITSQCALDNNRDVFVIPQNINSPTSVGSNNLLKTGAIPITEADDILNFLGIEKQEIKPSQNNIDANSPEELVILQNLNKEPTHVDKIIKNTSLPSHIVNSTLVILEINGKIKNVGNMMYVLN